MIHLFDDVCFKFHFRVAANDWSVTLFSAKLFFLLSKASDGIHGFQCSYKAHM